MSELRTLEYFSNVKDGHLQRNVSEKIANDLKLYEGKRVQIRISKTGTSRTARQNNYLHALFEIFAKELQIYTGDMDFTKEYVKEMCKFKFLKKDIVNKETGEVIGHYIQRTRDLLKGEFAIFTEQVIQYAAEMFHITLPYPEEQQEIDLE